jgi:hypothetical protein
MIQGTHRYPPMERVIYGVPLAEALAQEVERIGANAVYVLASGTLERQTDVIDRVRAVLANKLAGVRQDRRPYPAHRRGGRSEWCTCGWRRCVAHCGRRLGDRCGEDGRPVPGQ